MRLGRLFCSLILFGISAVAAHAQTPISTSSLVGDPTVIFKPDPPGCTPPYCYNLEYTSAPNIVFFNVVPALPDPGGDTYGCLATGGLVCGVDVTVGPPVEFISVALYGAVDQTFTLSIIGGPITLVIPLNGVACLDGDCIPGESVAVDPTPEPATAVMYVTGLALLGCGVRKRSKASSALRPY